MPLIIVDSDVKDVQSYGDIPDIKDIVTYDKQYIYCLKNTLKEFIISIYHYNTAIATAKARGYCLLIAKIPLGFNYTKSTWLDIGIISTPNNIYYTIPNFHNRCKNVLYMFNKSWTAVLISKDIKWPAKILTAYGYDWIALYDPDPNRSTTLLNIMTGVIYELKGRIYNGSISLCDGIIYYHVDQHIYKFCPDSTSELIFSIPEGWKMLHCWYPSIVVYNTGISVFYINLGMCQITSSFDTYKYCQSYIYYKTGRQLFVYDLIAKSNTLISDNCYNIALDSAAHNLLDRCPHHLVYATSAEIITHEINTSKEIRYDISLFTEPMYREVPIIHYPIRCYSDKYSDIEIITV